MSRRKQLRPFKLPDAESDKNSTERTNHKLIEQFVSITNGRKDEIQQPNSGNFIHLITFAIFKYFHRFQFKSK